MSLNPIAPLRWYEHLILRWLSQSPRIARLVVYQNVEETTPEDDLHTFRLLVNQLEQVYRSPSADKEP